AADGIDVLTPSPGTVVLGNVVGLSVNGTPLGNGRDGVHLGAAGNVVGGTAPGARNVISANQGNGIFVTVPGRPGTAVNLIAGNYVGVGPDGVSSGKGNQQDGILLSNASNTTVGGTTPGAGNVISGNKQSGVHLTGTTTSATIQGNTVGLNAD